MGTIYVVVGEVHEYDSYEQWLVRAYEYRPHALAATERLNALAGPMDRFKHGGRNWRRAFAALVEEDPDASTIGESGPHYEVQECMHHGRGPVKVRRQPQSAKGRVIDLGGG